MLCETGSHSELIKDHDGAYSQLIRLQEANKQAERASLEDSGKLISSSDAAKSSFRSGSHRSSFRISISRASSSAGSGRHSFTIPLGLIGALEFQGDGPIEDEPKEKEDNDDKVGKQVSLRRLAYLNKPEIPVLLGGSIAAAGNGVLFPIFGLLISTAIEIFYKPPDKLRKEAVFWTLIFVLMGGFSLLIVPIQHVLFGVAGGKLIERLRSLSFERVVHQEISWFDEPQNSRFLAFSLYISLSCLNVRLFFPLKHCTSPQTSLSLRNHLQFSFSSVGQ